MVNPSKASRELIWKSCEMSMLTKEWQGSTHAIEVTLSWYGRRHYGLIQHEYVEASQRLLQLRLSKESEQWMIIATEGPPKICKAT